MYTASSSSRSSMVCLSIMLGKMLNKFGAKTQPCFTPLTMGKGLERLLFNLTWPCCSSCNWMIRLRNFGGQPKRFMISQKPFLLTVLNALIKSINVTYSSIILLQTFFLNLPKDKNHVCDTSVGSEATLGF